MRITSFSLVALSVSLCSLAVQSKKIDNVTELLSVRVISLQNNMVRAGYRTNLTVPDSLDADNRKEFETLLRDWTMRDALRKNPSAYTNLIMENDTTAKVKFRIEQITDPDGNPLLPGILHYHSEIPNCCDIYYVEGIWGNSGGDDLAGGIFQLSDGELSLVAETGRNRKPSFGMIGDRVYLCVSGSAGGPSWYREIYVFQDGCLIETFTCLEVYAKIDSCALNGKAISVDEGRAYIERLPELAPLDPTFNTLK